jgi:hypothetical protein
MKFILLFLVADAAYAQVFDPYKQYPLLKNTEHQHIAISTNNGIQVKNQVDNGSIQIVFVSNNNYRITYIPDQGFHGKDTLVYEFWNFINPSMMAPHYEHIIFNVQAILPVEDFITIHLNDIDVNVDVLANDVSDLPVSISSIVFSENVQAEIVNDSLVINPVLPGYGYVRYRICDDSDICTFGLLTVLTEDNVFQDTVNLQEFTPKGKSVAFYTGDGEYEVLLNPAHGNIVISNGVVTYQPNSTYTGNDFFKLERSYHDSIRIYQVNIQVLPYTNPFRMVTNDQVFTTRNDAINFNVIDNDLIQNKPIQSHTQPANGSLTYLGSGEFIYTPNYNHLGTDFFTYKVCAISNVNCETARVDIRVDNFLPEKGIYNLRTSQNQPFIFEYTIPVSTYDFEVLEQAFQGEIIFYPNQQEIQIGNQSVSGYNLLIYTPPTNFSGTDEMRIQYCAGGECKSVKIYMQVLDEELSACIDDCVWPGDVNRDGEVNVFDMLPIAYHVGHTGSIRSASPEEEFLAYESVNWEYNQFNNQDLKHADADGDGSISSLDKEVLLTYYQEQNKLKPVTYNPLYNVPFILDLATPEIEIGETAIFNIIIGTAQYPAIDFRGLAFQLNLGNADFFDTASLQLTLYPDSWLCLGGPSADLTVKAGSYLLDGAIARLDTKYKSGYGIIGKFEGIIVKDIGGFHLKGDYYDIPISVAANQVVDHQGNSFTLPAVNTKLRVKIGKTSKYASSGVRVYPNPAQDMVTINTLDDSDIQAIQMFSISGNILKQVDQVNSASLNMDISSLPSGMYILKTLTTNGVHSVKLKVIK